MGCCISVTKTTAPVKVARLEARPRQNSEKAKVTKRKSEEVANYLSTKLGQPRNLTQLIVLDMLGQFPGNRNKLRITQTAVSYFTLKEMMRLSFTCKRLYIILGDQLILKRFTDSQTKGM